MASTSTWQSASATCPRAAPERSAFVRADKGGDISIGVNGRFEDVWFLSLNVTDYFGAGAPIATNGAAGTVYMYKQALKDRDFASFSLGRAF